MADPFVLRPLSADEVDAYFAFIGNAFHEVLTPDEQRAEESILERDRTLVLFDGDTMIGSTAILSRIMTVPGGPIPVAGVTEVAVAASHTRRGLLTQLMRAQLTELHDERREAVAVLWASESAIYQRFGYGLASQRARISLSNRDVRLLRPVAAAERGIRIGDAADKAIVADVAASYDRARTGIVGHCDRPGPWWEYRLFDPESARDGATALRIAVHYGAAGPDGYALYAVRKNWGAQGPDGEVLIKELTVENSEAHAALWSHLMSVDLTADVTFRVGPEDAPVQHMVDHPRRVDVAINDALWVRIVDVDRALAARRYTAPVDVVFEVTDAFCPWNAGRWRLTGGPDDARCARTDAPADLALSSTELGAAYLGGSTLAILAAAGRVTELQPGTLRATSAAFAEPRPPYCAEIF